MFYVFRLVKNSTVKYYLRDTKRLCITNEETLLDSKQNDVQIIKKVTKGTNTRTYFIKLPSDIGNVAVKFISANQSQSSKTYNELYDDPLYIETSLLRLCSSVVLQNCIPNLPIMYTYGRCNGTNEVMTVSELANMDIEDYIRTTTTPITETKWRLILAQIYAGLLYLQNFGICHNDMHWGNILVHDIGHPTVLHYRFGGEDYYIPCPDGKMFVLWDFELAYVLGKTRMDHLTETDIAYTHVMDYYRISKLPDWCLKEGYTAMQYPKYTCDEIDEMARLKMPLREVFKEMFKEFKTPPQGITMPDDIHDSYQLDALPKILANEHIYLLSNKDDIEVPLTPNQIKFNELRHIAMSSGSNTARFNAAIRALEGYKSGSPVGS